MKSYQLRRLQSKVSVNSKRTFKFKVILKALFLILITALILFTIIYLSTYNGYQSKLIQQIDTLPSEYKIATIVLDAFPENDNLLLGFLDRAYESRKFTSAKIYTLEERTEEDIKSIIKKMPLAKVELDLMPKTPFAICKSIEESYSDKKTVAIANPDLSVRLANICNNFNILVIPASIEDTDFLVYTTSIRTRVDELLKILFNQMEKDSTLN